MRTVLLALTLAACGSSPPPTPATPPPPASPPPAAAPAPAPMTLTQSGIVPEWMDRSADPCKDFYEHACGTFVRTAVIPPDRSGWGAIHVVTKEAEDLLHEVLEKAAREPGDDPVKKKIGDYYAACMDEEAVERAGLTPLAPLMQSIAAVRDAATARKAVIELHASAVFPLFSTDSTEDFGDATQVIAGLDQDGLGLPDRDYYLKDDGNMKEVRATYRAHLERILGLAGVAPAGKAADDVMRLETAIARLQQDQVARRNPRNIYHRIGLTGLMKAAPTFPWKDYLARLGIGQVTAITVNDPAYFSGVLKLFDRQKPAVVQAYLTARLLEEYSEELGKAFVAEHHVMDKALNGVEELAPRWRRCLESTDDDLGQLLGQSYVAVRFAGDSRARAIDLTKAVLAAMDAEIGEIGWMDDQTRQGARQKLGKMAYLVGYPDVWRQYDFDVGRASHMNNVLAAVRFEHARRLKKIGRPVDRTDWTMTPPTVNAYYESTLNQMVLPAGQLQPPFFGATFHPAVNFGGTGGGTIGHEMTHGFDDEGSQFDGDGNLRDWWSPDTRRQFDAASRCVIDQYGKYEAVPGVKLNGALTAGENIADVGGVKIAYRAYQSWKAAQPAPPPAEVEGYSDDQLYFLAYAQSWCMKETPERLESRAHSDPHSPARWRVNGVIVDQPGFAKAFKCTAGAPMAPPPDKMCSVW